GTAIAIRLVPGLGRQGTADAGVRAGGPSLGGSGAAEDPGPLVSGTGTPGSLAVAGGPVGFPVGSVVRQVEDRRRLGCRVVWGGVVVGCRVVWGGVVVGCRVVWGGGVVGCRVVWGGGWVGCE